LTACTIFAILNHVYAAALRTMKNYHFAYHFTFIPSFRKAHYLNLITNNLIIVYGLKKIIFPVCDRNFFGQEKSCLTWGIETRGNQQHRPESPSS